jgi:putative oxidoreductase
MKKSVVLLGRILFSIIFVLAARTHFSAMGIGYAASQGVPAANILVPLSGLMAILGGLSVATGYKARWGAWLLVLFLVPVTFMMHRFWDVADPMAQQMQMVNFMKNLAMLGGALMITYFGAGPLSIDSWMNRKKQFVWKEKPVIGEREKEEIPEVRSKVY